MKRFFLASLVCLSFELLFGQAQILDANEVSAWISPSFRLFAAPSDSTTFGFFHSNFMASTRSTIRDAELWIGGFDPSGNLKIVAGRERDKLDSTACGPLHANTGLPIAGAENWCKTWKVSKPVVLAFRNDLADGQLDNPIPPSILAWPGRGSKHFDAANGFPLPTISQSLAPFVDQNFDGKYEPEEGDYPGIQVGATDTQQFPDQICWSVFNAFTNGNVPLQLEIQLTAFAYSCGGTVLDRTIFTSHKFFNRSKVALDSVSIGFWTDFNIGGPADDMIGSAPQKHAFFGFNGDNLDETASGQPGFQVNPPVQSCQFLMPDTLSRFLYCLKNPPIAQLGPPKTAVESYRFLTGHWPDGTSLTPFGSGWNPGSSLAPVNFAFPDSPNLPGGWDMIATNQPATDVASLGVVDLNQFLGAEDGRIGPGKSFEILTAWMLHSDLTKSNLMNYDRMVTETAFVREAMNNLWMNTCETTGQSVEPEKVNAGLIIFPNPTTDHFRVNLPEAQYGLLRIFNLSGQQVFEKKDARTDAGLLEISVTGWPMGIYLVAFLTEKSVQIGRFVVCE